MANPRSSATADNSILVFTEKFLSECEDIRHDEWDEVVLEVMVVDSLEELYRKSRLLKGRPTPRPGHLMDLLLFDEVNLRKAPLSCSAACRPKRWPDTKLRLRHDFIFYGIAGDPSTHRAITFWIGKELIERCRAESRDIAGFIHKRISDRLRRHLPGTRFGVWFHVEPMRDQPDALHAHGLLWIDDADVFFKKRRYGAMREQIRLATGFDKSMTKRQWLHTADNDLSAGWVTYCRKTLIRKRAAELLQQPKLMIDGYTGEAGSQSLKRSARVLYERMRKVYLDVLEV